MKSDFDRAALTYDKDFTNSLIGIAQRNQVWKYLNRYLHHKDHVRILELNCGTGEDALRFAQQGHQVTATDISEQMLNVARSKNTGKKANFLKLDLTQIKNFESPDKFDLVFSNFGGLNCLAPEVLEEVNLKVSNLLTQDGCFVAVIMPQYCLWESLYFTLKGRWTEVLRRKKEFAIANVSDEQVKTYYFSPSAFEKLGNGRFKRETLKPIGLFIPPSYLENFFKKRKILLQVFNKLDSLLARFGWQAYISDHYYIQFTVKCR